MEAEVEQVLIATIAIIVVEAKVIKQVLIAIIAIIVVEANAIKQVLIETEAITTEVEKSILIPMILTL